MIEDISRSYSPRSGQPFSDAEQTTSSELAILLDAATKAAKSMLESSPRQRSTWLHAMADALEAYTAELVGIADGETALGVERLTGELAKTVAQTRFYADVAIEGSYLGVVIDTEHALARMNRPLGPVAVFGASNFPFVLGIVGHDVASAIAAGCPVVAKAHDAHIGLSMRLRDVVRSALQEAGAPMGVYDVVVGFASGVDLVKDEAITAVAFTGSESGGRALWRIANDRNRPVPVYAEMGTVNPAIITSAALPRIEEIAPGFVASFTGSSGQYCTKPGVLFAPAGVGAVAAVANAFDRSTLETPLMLTEAIAGALRLGIDQLVEAGATMVRRGPAVSSGHVGQAALLEASPSTFLAGGRVLEECFGPVAVVVEYESADQLRACLEVMQPALVAAIWTSSGGGDSSLTELVDLLASKVGRVVVNDWTTGAPHSWAQHHGGPWPATSNGGATSIGAAALDRFVRPVAYQNLQNLPAEAVPAALLDANPWGVARRVNGESRSAVEPTF